MHLNWQIKHYNDLTTNEFHDLIALRMEIFVVEQDCPYQDLDGKDKKSYHMICRDGMGNLAGTARILPAGLSLPHGFCTLLDLSVGVYLLAPSVHAASCHVDEKHHDTHFGAR